MKDLICPKCKKKQIQIIFIQLAGWTRYSFRKKYGHTAYHIWNSNYNENIVQLNKKGLVHGFACRWCEKPFPKRMEKEALDWVMFKHNLSILMKN